MDFAGPVPVSEDQSRYVIVAIDYFTKYIEVRATTDQTAKSAAVFLQQLMDRYGVMSLLHIDHGRHFMGEFQALMDANHIDLIQSRPYHPQSNGLTERAVKTMTTALRMVVHDNGQDRVWNTHLPAIMRGYNMSKQASTGFSPFFLMHGFHPVFPKQTRDIPLLSLEEAAEADAEEARLLSETAVPGLHPTLSFRRDVQPTPRTPETLPRPSLSGLPSARHTEAPEPRTTTSSGVAHHDVLTQSRLQASANIKKAQARQSKDFNRRRGIHEDTPLAQPWTLFKQGDLVLTREFNPNKVLKPGELAGSGKLRGAVRGPFIYEKKFSDTYCTIKDMTDRSWERPYVNVILFDSNRDVKSYSIKDFAVPSKTALEAGASRTAGLASLADHPILPSARLPPPSQRHFVQQARARVLKRKRNDEDEDEDDDDETYAA